MIVEDSWTFSNISWKFTLEISVTYRYWSNFIADLEETCKTRICAGWNEYSEETDWWWLSRYWVNTEETVTKAVLKFLEDSCNTLYYRSLTLSLIAEPFIFFSRHTAILHMCIIISLSVSARIFHCQYVIYIFNVYVYNWQDSTQGTLIIKLLFNSFAMRWNWILYSLHNIM